MPGEIPSRFLPNRTILVPLCLYSLFFAVIWNCFLIRSQTKIASASWADGLADAAASARHVGPLVNRTLPEITMSAEAFSARNQFHGTVKSIVSGPVISEIVVDTLHGLVTSVITTRSLSELRIAIGSEVRALVKPTEVAIART